MARPRTQASYSRREPQQEGYDTVLIVCEGSKTEPHYFEGLRRAWRLSSANIVVVSPGVTDPPNLVAITIAKMREGGYDRAFCVFDRDSHAGFQQALDLAANCPEGRARKLKAIVSWPCFEIWILLHFTMTTKAFAPSGKRSSGDMVLQELAGHYADYAKGSKTVFDALADKLETALANAKRLEKHNADTGSENPATDMHELINYLLELRDTAQKPVVEGADAT